ncbi:hypothetical protein CR513_42224, partial [Mucuna pruriens]
MEQSLEVEKLEEEIACLKIGLAKFVDGLSKLHILNEKRKDFTLVPRQWMLTIHDKRRIYAPRPKATLRDNLLWRKWKRKDCVYVDR